MHLLKLTLAAVIVGAWLSWDFASVGVRTFVVGHSLRRQLEEIQEDESE